MVGAFGTPYGAYGGSPYGSFGGWASRIEERADHGSTAAPPTHPQAITANVHAVEKGLGHQIKYPVFHDYEHLDLASGEAAIRAYYDGLSKELSALISTGSPLNTQQFLDRTMAAPAIGLLRQEELNNFAKSLTAAAATQLAASQAEESVYVAQAEAQKAKTKGKRKRTKIELQEEAARQALSLEAAAATQQSALIGGAIFLALIGGAVYWRFYRE